MTNYTEKESGERLLKTLLEELDKKVFVTSTNSITGEKDILNPVIKDYEAIIKISGEWDREDLKGIILSLFREYRETVKADLFEKVQKAESLNDDTRNFFTHLIMSSLLTDENK